MGSKFKLSDTMQFLTGKLNAITGGEVALQLVLDNTEVVAGRELRAEVRVLSPEKDRNIDYLLISLEGTVQREGKWEEYVQSAEVAQDTALPADHEFMVPVVIVVPADAVLTEDGSRWRLYARAFLDKRFDPQAEQGFAVVAD